ncbi:response regulator transcription factor [Nitrincola sp.]|uniref:response regulator transcription factor n=1 Tax=Nitrincola sp. TaxID=1926584 RepID=UPI003A95744A
MEKSRVLLVEDDESLCQVVTDFFNMFGYQISQAQSGDEFSRLIRQQAFDIILLDLNLPDADGLELLRMLREEQQVLLYVVSGRQDETSRLRAYELGADDFIAKPFSARELELKVRNALKRHGPVIDFVESQDKQPGVFIFQGWQLEEATRSVCHQQGKQIQLTRGEYELLAFLAEAGGAVVTRDNLLNHLEQAADIYSAETITALVYRLRRKFAQTDLDSPIVTLSRIGYRLEIS